MFDIHYCHVLLVSFWGLGDAVTVCNIACVQKNKKPWRMTVPIPAIVKDVLFYSPLDTVPRADTKSSWFLAAPPCSFQLLRSSPCSFLTMPLPASFLPGCPDSFWQGRNTGRYSLMTKLLNWECSPQAATQKIFRKIPRDPLLAIWATLQVYHPLITKTVSWLWSLADPEAKKQDWQWWNRVN